MKNILMDRLSKVYEVGLGFNQLQPTSLFISTIYQDTIAKLPQTNQFNELNVINLNSTVENVLSNIYLNLI